MREEDDYLDKYVVPYRIVCKFQEGSLGSKDSAPDTTELQYQANRFKENNIFYLSGFNKDTFKEASQGNNSNNSNNTKKQSMGPNTKR
jgi:hypothetical protein